MKNENSIEAFPSKAFASWAIFVIALAETIFIGSKNPIEEVKTEDINIFCYLSLIASVLIILFLFFKKIGQVQFFSGDSTADFFFTGYFYACIIGTVMALAITVIYGLKGDYMIGTFFGLWLFISSFPLSGTIMYLLKRN